MELQLQNLALSFKNKPNVIHDISLTMNGGSIVGIVAPNGTGKTTLLRLILNDLKPQAGNRLSMCLTCGTTSINRCVPIQWA